ncbi:MAG TPA: hypothetical protein VGL08_17715 [Paraburkholderia sp.]|jgi:hypothetical protein
MAVRADVLRPDDLHVNVEGENLLAEWSEPIDDPDLKRNAVDGERKKKAPRDRDALKSSSHSEGRART